MLAVVAFTLRGGGLVVLARMNEIIFVILVTIFLSLFLLALKDIKISRLTPISPLDFFPVLQANIGVMVVFSHLPFLFLLSNYVNNKEKLKKVCLQASGILAFLLMLLLIVTIGMLGSSTIELTQVPYITAIKQISLFGTLERIEAAVVSQWIFSDYMIISIMLLTVLNMFKSLFKLSDFRPFFGIYSVITLLTALMIARNAAELELFISTIVFPPVIFLGFAMPVLVFVVGKIRKKL
jgi:spore germination protein (amino acid permease)